MRTFPRLFIGLGLCFALLIVPALVFAQDGGTISYGQTVSGEITDQTPEIRYTFSGAGGDAIIISMMAQPGGNLDSYLNLFDSSDNLLASDDDGGEGLNSLLGPFVLPADGSYTIVATRCCGGGGQGGSTGPFSLSLTQTERNPLNLNETVTIELTDDAPFAFRTIEAEVGSVLSLNGEHLEGASAFTIGLRDPQGGYVNQVYGQPGIPALLDPIFITQAGSYQVVINREPNYSAGQQQTSGNVRVGLTLSNVDAQPVQFGAPVNGTLSNENPSDHYTFTGTAQDLLRVEGSTTPESQPVELLFIGPDGFQFNGITSFYGDDPTRLILDPLQLNASGEFLVVVRRIDNGSGMMSSSQYNFTLSESQTPVLQSGVEIIDTVGQAVFEKVFRFDGVAGQTIRVTLRSVDDNYGPSMNVMGPNPQTDAAMSGSGGGGFGPVPGGQFLFNISSAKPGTATYEVTLDTTGVYLFRVNNAIYNEFGTGAGQFGLTVEVAQ